MIHQTWENGWNKKLVCSSDKPMPVSTTSNPQFGFIIGMGIQLHDDSHAAIFRELDGVAMRFTRICRSRRGSV